MLALRATPLAAQVEVRGTATERDGTPVPEARVILASADTSGSTTEVRTDGNGSFRISLDLAGRYLLSLERPGYFPVRQRAVELVEGTNHVNVEVVPSEDAGTTVEVRAYAQLAAKEADISHTLQENEIDSVPMSRSTKQRIQGVAAILPGVLRDPGGEMHFHGSAAEETNWSLDGFTVTDPATGRLEMALGAESVGSMDLLAGRYSAAVGKGAGGAMVVRTRTGDDEFRQRITNFVPGVDFQEGLRIRDWRPRYALSGPIIENRLWYFNSLDLLYEENFIPELPDGQDRSSLWSVNNSLRLHGKLSPRQTLHSGYVADYLRAPRFGLSPLDPIETTYDRRGGRHFFNVADQIVLSPETVLDFGYAAYRSTYRGVPKGSEPYRISVFGRSGNYPVSTSLESVRDEGRVNLVVPARALGRHQVRAGANLGHTRYSQDILRSPIGYLSADGTLSGLLSFGGTGEFSESNVESGAYLQDRWTIGSRLVADLGIRWDRDRIVGAGTVTPRLGVAFMPAGLEGTRVSAGIGWIPVATQFRIFTRHRDHSSAFTRFAEDGATPLGAPQFRFFSLDREDLVMPTTRNLNASWNQRLWRGTDLNVNYLRKRLEGGYAHLPGAIRSAFTGGSGPATVSIEFPLRNSRRDDYDSFEVSLGRRLSGSHRWFASYTYSRSWSNVAVDVDTDDLIRFSETAGRLPWDIPHRLVAWATFPAGERTSVALFSELRDGFPFSAHDVAGEQFGPINGWRLPRHFSLNVHVERKLSLFGHRWAVRPGVDNVTNRPNYQFANANTSSTEYLRFLGRSPIKLVVRVRWLGPADP